MIATVRESPAVRVEKAYEKHAWIIFFALGIAGLGQVFSLVFTGEPPAPEVLKGMTGMTWSELVSSNPGFANYVSFILREWGYSFFFFDVLFMAVSLKSYRRGEKWAWYAFWILPIYSGLAVAEILRVGAGVFDLALNVAFGIASLLGLLLPYRKFFPGKPP